MMTDGNKEMSFEESMERLEGLIRKLEGGSLDLDESLSIYAEAVELRERCRKILNESERKVQVLMNTSDGLIKEEFKV